MIGKMQDLVSAAVVFNAVDSASRGAPEAREQYTAPDTSGQAAAPTPKTDAPVKTASEGQKADAESQDAEIQRAQKQAREQQRKLDEKTVDMMTRELNELMSKIDCNLQFKYNKDVDVMTVKMIDKNTNDVIKEFPPEEMVKSMLKTKEWIGAFLDEHA